MMCNTSTSDTSKQSSVTEKRLGMGLKTFKDISAATNVSYCLNQSNSTNPRMFFMLATTLGKCVA